MENKAQAVITQLACYLLKDKSQINPESLQLLYQRDQVVYDLVQKIAKTCKKEELADVFANVTEILKSKTPEQLVQETGQNLNEDDFSGTFNVGG